MKATIPYMFQRGCISEGETLDEARVNIREAIAVWFEDEIDETVPAGCLVEEIAV